MIALEKIKPEDVFAECGVWRGESRIAGNNFASTYSASHQLGELCHRLQRPG